MADVYAAYKFLSDALQLNLTDDLISQTEQKFKAEFAKSKGFDIESDEISNWEFFSYLQPKSDRKKKGRAAD